MRRKSCSFLYKALDFLKGLKYNQFFNPFIAIVHYIEKKKNFIVIREVISQLIFLQRNHLPSVKKPYMKFAEKKNPCYIEIYSRLNGKSTHFL